MNDTVQLPAGEAQRARDLAVDPRSGELLLLGRKGKKASRYFLRRYSRSGRKVQEWLLPSRLEPVTGVYGQTAGYRLVMVEWEQSKSSGRGPGFFAQPKQPVRLALVTLSPQVAAPEVQELDEGWSSMEHDTALNPPGTRRVHAIMRQVSYKRQTRVGEHRALPGGPSEVYVNAPDLGYDIVDRSQDQSLVFFGWNSLHNSVLARRTTAGAYETYEMEPFLKGALEKFRMPGGALWLMNTALYADLALFGITDVRKGERADWVVEVEVSASRLGPARVKKGQVARVMKHF